MDNVKIDMSGFKIIEASLKDKYSTRIGILGSKASADHGGLSNVEIGTIHEFGSVSQGIPKRSFLKMPLELKIWDWVKKNRDNYFQMLKEKTLKKFYIAMGHEAESIVEGAFASGGYGRWAKLQPKTIKAKGDGTILVESSQLKNSISSTVINDK